jgi:hypothetical protein
MTNLITLNGASKNIQSYAICLIKFPETIRPEVQLY